MKKPFSQLKFSAMHKLFIFTILTYAFAPVTQACWFTTKWEMSVTNNITDNIVAHIKSGDDDLGNHTLPFKGNYDWSFCDRFDGHTLFYAYFWWGSKFQSMALFDDNIRKICARNKGGAQHCNWLVQPDGFYASAYPDRGWVKTKTWG